jgi:hypothetical protein
MMIGILYARPRMAVVGREVTLEAYVIKQNLATSDLIFVCNELLVSKGKGRVRRMNQRSSKCGRGGVKLPVGILIQ